MWWAQLLNSIIGFLGSGAGGGGGSYESIATATPSGTTTVTFSSIPSTYASLQARFYVAAGSTGLLMNMTINGDTGSNYAYHQLYGTGSAASAYAGSSATKMWLSPNTNATYGWTGIVDLHDYASTSKNKTVRSYSGFDANGSGIVGLDSGLWMSTSAMTSLTFTLQGNFASGSQFALYGIKGA